MFAPRRLCVYPFPLSAPARPNFPLSPIFDFPFSTFDFRPLSPPPIFDFPFWSFVFRLLSPKSFISPPYTKSARKSFVSPTYAKTGGWGPKFRRNSFHLKSYFTFQRRISLVSNSASSLPTRQVSRNVCAPTFSHPATRRRTLFLGCSELLHFSTLGPFHSPFPCILCSTHLSPPSSVFTILQYTNVGAPTFLPAPHGARVAHHWSRASVMLYSGPLLSTPATDAPQIFSTRYRYHEHHHCSRAGHETRLQFQCWTRRFAPARPRAHPRRAARLPRHRHVRNGTVAPLAGI